MNDVTFTFPALPRSAAELAALPEAALADPAAAAALTAAALARYGDSPEDAVGMLDALKGPQPLTPFEKQFLRDRLKGKSYVPLSYFAGASPENGYVPERPYRVTVSETPQSYAQEGYAQLYLRSSGADAPRPVKLRRKGGRWYLWEQFLLADIRKPKSEDPWA